MQSKHQASKPLRDNTWAMWKVGAKNKDALKYLRTHLGLPYVRLGARKILYEEEAVERWIKQRSVNGQQATD